MGAGTFHLIAVRRIRMQDRYMEETAKSRGFSGRETDTSTYEYIKIHKDIARSF